MDCYTTQTRRGQGLQDDDVDMESASESDDEGCDDICGKTGYIVVADDISDTECDSRLVDFGPIVQAPRFSAGVVGERSGAGGFTGWFGNGRGSAGIELSPTSQYRPCKHVGSI